MDLVLPQVLNDTYWNLQHVCAPSASYCRKVLLETVAWHVGLKDCALRLWLSIQTNLKPFHFIRNTWTVEL